MPGSILPCWVRNRTPNATWESLFTDQAFVHGMRWNLCLNKPAPTPTPRWFINLSQAKVAEFDQISFLWRCQEIQRGKQCSCDIVFWPSLSRSSKSEKLTGFYDVLIGCLGPRIFIRTEHEHHSVFLAIFQLIFFVHVLCTCLQHFRHRISVINACRR